MAGRVERRMDVLSGHLQMGPSVGGVDPQEASSQLLAGAAGIAGAAYFYKKFHLGRDIPFIIKFAKLQSAAKGFLNSNQTTADLFESRCDSFPNKDAVVFEDRHVSYRELDGMANRMANWAQNAGIRRGDVVALIMENRPEYISIWLGLSKIGAITALINTNLREKQVVHCVSVSKAQHVIVGSELVADVVPSLKKGLPADVTYWVSGGDHPECKSLDPLVSAASSKRPPADIRKGLGATNHLFYIYTSGTTGLPKAAVIKHLRFFLMGQSGMHLCGTTAEDRIYCCLPLYHSAGGALGVGMTWGPGATMVLRKKFSAKHFFEDCRKYRCTVIQYIGELCRYLLAVPPRPVDTDHCVKKAIGNGLRPDIWETFQKRFNVPIVCEFYGSTEGNAALFNPGARACAVGFIPPLIERFAPMTLVKFDVQEEVPIRDKNGFCIRCGSDEPGELLAKIEESDPLLRFDGYIGKGNTQKKILRDVFQKGDAFFRSGDLLKKDKDGYFYFVDRIGDTFRWKGENVSTNEVAEVLSAFPGCNEVNVYGVSVPGADGRAGMACMVMADNLDLKGLFDHTAKELPAYARPLFLRKAPEIEITGTFKHRKVELVKDGFIPKEDPVFFRDEEAKTYVPVTPEIIDAINAQKVRL